MCTEQDKSRQSQAIADRQYDVPIYLKIGPATEIPWLWEGRIPRGQVTLIEGAHGAGKSFVALDLAARFSKGVPWPDRGVEGGAARILANAATERVESVEESKGSERRSGEPCGVSPRNAARERGGEKVERRNERGEVEGGDDGDVRDAVPMGSVLLVTQQDGRETIDRRLAGLGADIDRIHRFETVTPEELADKVPQLPSNQRPVEFPRDVAIIRNELFDREEIALVVIDPLSDFCDGPARVAQTLRELSKLARQLDVAIVVTLPANCRFDARGALRVTSRYKTEAARCVWCVVADRDNPARRLLVARRTNSYVEPPGLAFLLHEGHVVWNAQAPIDALDPLGQEAAIRDCLTAALGSGSMPAADVLRLGALAGFAAAQMRVVAKLMGIEFHKMPGFGKDGGFEWVAPRDRGGERVESRCGEPCGVSPRVSGESREEERVEDVERVEESKESKESDRRKEGTSAHEGALVPLSQQADGRPLEGGTPADQRSGEDDEGVELERGVFAVPVVMSMKELMARTEAESVNANVAGPVQTEAPVAAVVATEAGAVKRAATDAKNSKSMENRGKNGHELNRESNGRLPRGKYARAQERKRRERQRRAGMLAGGR